MITEEVLQERLKFAKIVKWSEELDYSGGRIHVEYWLPPNPDKVAEIPRLNTKEPAKTVEAPYFEPKFDLF